MNSYPRTTTYPCILGLGLDCGFGSSRDTKDTALITHRSNLIRFLILRRNFLSIQRLCMQTATTSVRLR